MERQISTEETVQSHHPRRVTSFTSFVKSQNVSFSKILLLIPECDYSSPTDTVFRIEYLFLYLRIPEHVYIEAYVWMSVSTRAHAHVEKSLEVLHYPSPPIPSRQGISLNLRVRILRQMRSQLTPVVLLFLSPHPRLKL